MTEAMDRILIVANPAANHGGAARDLPKIEKHLGALGVPYDIQTTERAWHAADLAQAAARDGYSVVAAAGGDGTVNEVLNGLMAVRAAGEEVPALAVLGVGRGNDFAHGVGIPADLEAACRLLAQGPRRAIDVGHLVGGDYPHGRYFGNGIGIGFDARVGFAAAEMKRLTGFVAYLVAALKTIATFGEAPLTEIALDGQTLERRTMMVSVMNGRRMGGGFMMAPEGACDDGLFDLCIADAVNKLRILTLIPTFIQGAQADQREIEMGRAQRVVVTARDGSLAAHADGETICRQGSRLELTLLPCQLEVIAETPEDSSL